MPAPNFECSEGVVSKRFPQDSLFLTQLSLSLLLDRLHTGVARAVYLASDDHPHPADFQTPNSDKILVNFFSLLFHLFDHLRPQRRSSLSSPSRSKVAACAKEHLERGKAHLKEKSGRGLPSSFPMNSCVPLHQ